MVCPWPFMASLDSGVASVKPPESGKSFVQALSGPTDYQITQLPQKFVMGKSVRVRITQAEYDAGIVDCCSNIHGRITLRKGDSPLPTLALKLKLSKLWPSIPNWELIPLGKGFFEFHFNTVDDMRRVWAMGAVNLNPGLLRFYGWSSDFTPQAQAQTHAQSWVRLMHLPQEYWSKKTLMEIASGLGTPLIIDDTTLNRRFGLYARVLVDVDLSEQLFESIIVEREGHALSVMVQYERQPSFCTHCKMSGHEVYNCQKLTLNLNEDTSKTVHKAPTGQQQTRTSHSINRAGKLPVTATDDLNHNKTDTTPIIQDPNHAVTLKQQSYVNSTLKHDPKAVTISSQRSVAVHNTNNQGNIPAETLEDSTFNRVNSFPKKKSTSTVHKLGTNSDINTRKLPLLNSFELLNEDGDLPLGEARQAELVENHIPNAEGTLKVQKAQTGPHTFMMIPAHNGKGAKSVVTSNNRPVATVSKPVNMPTVSLNQQPDMVDFDTFDLQETTKEGDKGDEAENAAFSLHNSFEILNEDDELPIGEARHAELVGHHISNGMETLIAF